MVDSTPGYSHLSLAAAYDRVSQLLEGTDCTSNDSTDKTQEMLQLLSHCELLIQRAALFSSNEDADDLITSHMKYLLVRLKQGHSLDAAIQFLQCSCTERPPPCAIVRSRPCQLLVASGQSNSSAGLGCTMRLEEDSR